MRQHVFHRTADGRVAHLVWDPSTGRVGADRWDDAVRAPLAAGDPATIVTGGREHLVYCDIGGGLAHVFLDVASGDLHLAPPGPLLSQAAVGVPALLVTPDQLHTFVRGVGGGLQHTVTSLVVDGDVGADEWTRAAGAPALAGDPSVIATPGQQHAFYRTAGGAVQHILWSAAGGFGTDDWSARAGAPRAAGNPRALALDGEQHVFCRSTGGAIVHLHWDPSLRAPVFEDWTAASGAPLAVGEPIPMVAAGQLHVFYRSADGHLRHLLRTPGDARVHTDDWTARAGAPPAVADPTPLVVGGQQHLFYQTDHARIAHVLWQPDAAGGGFGVDDWTTRAGGPLAAGRPATMLSTTATDPTALRVLAVGDSITKGLDFTDPSHQGTASGGYRAALFRLARRAGRRLVFVGSQFDGPLETDGASFPRAHEGHSGATIHDLTLCVGKLTGTRPHVVLLMVGTNDVLQDLDLASGQDRRVANFLEQLRTVVGGALIVVAQIPPTKPPTSTVFEPKDRPAARYHAYNDAVRAAVVARSAVDGRIVLVDMYTAFGPELLSLDGVHPNQDGYAHMADVWFAAMGRVH